VRLFSRTFSMLLVPALLVLAGCGGRVTANPSNATFSIAPGSNAIDTNCTGCNATGTHGSEEQFTAKLASGGAANVTWSVSGGDASSGAGSVSATGQYTPPSYLTSDRTDVLVTASLVSNPGITASALLTVTPGFLQPLTPENAALGSNGTLSVTGYLAEAGGTAGIHFALADSASGSSGGQGSLGATTCQRSAQVFTSCTVTYTAPSSVAATGASFIVAAVGTSASRTAAAVLLNTGGISSNPATHQAQLATPMQLGSSGGNNHDYDATGNTIVDCCGGTLGALLQGSDNRQYLLSNNHVLARSDHASVGDLIVQPGLIDNNCTPNGEGGGTTPVGSLTGWLPLSSSLTNADAAIAQVASRAVDSSGSILEMGARQAGGKLAAAPPGISSTGGKGESATVNLTVAKSGRTTGLTCGSVSALSLDVKVDYFTDCAETKPYLTKTYSNQVAISGNGFSDAGDSGSLVVDANNAEPVGLFFAGGTDSAGVNQGVANPVSDVLSELSTQVGGGTTYSFVGGELRKQYRGSGPGARADRRGSRTRRTSTGPFAGEPLGRHPGRGHGKEQRPCRRGRPDCLRGRRDERERSGHGERRTHPGDSHHGPCGSLRFGSAGAGANQLCPHLRLGVEFGSGHQATGCTRSDAPESSLLRRGSGPESGQSQRGRAGRLRGPQADSGATACGH